MVRVHHWNDQCMWSSIYVVAKMSGSLSGYSYYGTLFLPHPSYNGQAPPVDMVSSLQFGLTALTGASIAGHLECIKLLLDRGAQANLQNKVSAVPDQTNAC